MTDNPTDDQVRKRIEVMPWRVAARLKCLELASSHATRQAIADPCVVAEKYFAWVLEQSPTEEAPRQVA